MRIIDYKPHIYDNNAEMNALLNSLNIEFENNTKNNITKIYNNTFIKLADVQGIEQFEALFGIVALPDTESLDFRRQRIIMRLNSQLPYTYRYLEQKLNDILGEGNWEATLTYNTYTLEINLVVPGKEWYGELINLLDTVLPCNIEYIINIYKANWNQVKEHFSTWNDISSMTWQEVLDAQWIDD